MIIMKRLIIGIVVCLLIASCIVILPITSTVANRLGETDGILTCSVTKKQSSQTTSPVIWDKETFAAFYSLAQTVNATFHGADPHMEYPLEETSYTLYLEHHLGRPRKTIPAPREMIFYLASQAYWEIPYFQAMEEGKIPLFSPQENRKPASSRRKKKD